jgi:hypothetical protein
VLITVSGPQEPGREHFLEEVARQADLYWEPNEEAPLLPAPSQLALEFG